MTIDEGKLLEQTSLGSHAQAELNTLGKAFSDVRAELTTAWAASGPKQEHDREKLWLAVSLLTRVENIMRGYAANGRVAQKQLDEIRKAGEPKTVFGIRR